MRRALPLVLLVTIAVVLAGCAKPAPVTTHQFSASGGKASAGWAYDGAGVTPASATLAGSLDDAANTGSVNVSFSYFASTYVVSFASFVQDKDFQDGGVRFNFDEHGDSTNGDALLPKMHVKAAAWGVAKVTKDGEVLKGKTSDEWLAHLMISDDTVRGADGKIQNAAGTAAYNPAAPTDAKIVAGDAQVLFSLKSPDGESAMREPVAGAVKLGFQGPEATLSADIPSEKGAVELVVNVTLTAMDPAPVGVGRATISLIDANGNTTKTVDLTLTPQGPLTQSFVLKGAEVTGAFKLQVKGEGVFSANVDYVVTFDDHPFMVLTWDEVTVT